MSEAVEREVRVRVGGAELAGDLVVPAQPDGVVLFAHGSGSSRHSRRNRQVAGALHREGLATLLLDLLTAAEEERDRATAELRFDVAMLAARLVAATDLLQAEKATTGLPLGAFGASTGAGAALLAAAERPGTVAAVVSRGGRPDLAGEALARVRAPTLLVVGGRDQVVLDLNRAALTRLPAPSRLEVVAGATHLFEEPGALEEVSRLASAWFTLHLRPGSRW